MKKSSWERERVLPENKAAHTESQSMQQKYTVKLENQYDLILKLNENNHFSSLLSLAHTE